ncbi:recombination protein Rad52, partial [Trematosphaeria pertusa]
SPGDQYGDIKNPFVPRVVNQFTAQEIATLQSRLNRQLGPEYISQRPGNGGGRVAYLEGNKAIALANEVFGFNGWSSSLGQVQVDFVDEHPQGGKVSLGLSINVRITLKDGTYHEDIGYGSAANNKDKASAFEKAKKEAATDGLKRALRTFGNVLGNCLYDKEYLKKVQAMKVKPVKFQENNLYRHPDFAPQPKEEDALIKMEPHRTPVKPNQALRTRTEHLSREISGEFDDEYDGNFFDGVEITEHHTDEFTFETVSAAEEVAPKALEASKPANAPNGAGSSRPAAVADGGPPRQSNPRMQTTPAMRSQDGTRQQPHPQQPPQNQGPGRPPMQPPNSRGTTTPTAIPPPNHRPPVGFVTSRAAELVQNSDSATSFTHLPAFNPHADSPVPKEQRTPGVDHTRSIPIKRQEVGALPPPAPQLGGFNRPGGGAGRGNMNFVNPQQDMNRRIGMPGANGMSPGLNRGAYKPPMKRPPLQDVSNQAGNLKQEGEPEAKRQRVDAPGSENAGAGVVGS